jgi:biopolymer transport protein ExbD
MGRRKKRHPQGGVELNLAAMLDMAFQLLTFFILTFKPAPVEGQISLRLPPPQRIKTDRPVTPPPTAAANVNEHDPAVTTLTINVKANQSGMIDELAVGDGGVHGLAALNGRLKEVFADPGNPFEQVVIQVNSTCRYDELMRVVDICTHQVLPDGKKLSKLSFIEATDGG